MAFLSVRLRFRIHTHTLFKAYNPSMDFCSIVLWIAGTAGWAPLVSPVGKLNLESFNYSTLRPQIYFCKLVHACCLMLFVRTYCSMLFRTFPCYSRLFHVSYYSRSQLLILQAPPPALPHPRWPLHCRWWTRTPRSWRNAATALWVNDVRYERTYGPTAMWASPCLYTPSLSGTMRYPLILPG